ncbi:MAG: glycosyltransferase, partial [Candidatus Dadabacteria bacterium]|nr:glycosyltransferase [Candidatus Dadabacteria bacterium]
MSFPENEIRKLNIAMVAACPFPANHGTPGSIREMAQAVSDQGHKVHIVTYPFGEGDNPSGVKLHRISGLGLKKKIVVGPTKEKPILDVLMVFTLIRVIQKEKIDIIHGHNYEGALIGFLGKILTGRPLVYNAINNMIDELPSYNFFKPKILAVWLANILDFIVPRMADQIIAISEELVQFLIGQNINPNRVHFIPLGVNTQPFEGFDQTTSRKILGLGENPLVVYTGTVDHFQRIDYLLKAMGIVCQQIPEVKLLIVANIASEKDVNELKEFIKDLNLENNVDFVLNKSLEEVPHFISAADVAVVSRPDCPGFPVKLLNYMAASKPIVLFEGTSKGLEHLKNVFIVEDHDWKGMGHGIITLLNDPGLAERMAQNVKRWVKENYEWEGLIERIE